MTADQSPSEPASAPDIARLDDNPAPAGLRALWVTGDDGLRLRCAISPSATGSTRGTVLILQGRNEALEKYFETMIDLNRMGFMAATFDWRGQGGSDAEAPKEGADARASHDARRRSGHVRRLADYLTDLETVVHDLLLSDCRPPFAVLGHSMGGLIALAANDRLSNRIERLVLSAPLVDLPKRRLPLGWLRLFASLLRVSGFGKMPITRAAVWGKVTTPATSPLTSDPGRFTRNRNLAERHPQLFLNAPTIGWVAAMTAAMQRLDQSDAIAKLSIPTLILCAGADRVVSTPAAERLAWRMRNASSLTLPGARHEILQEADRHREPLLAALDVFLTEALPRQDDETLQAARADAA